MAGSFGHVLDDNDAYRGTSLLENMGDMAEAVDQMAFMLLLIREQFGRDHIDDASRQFFECMRGERPWPDWWKPESN